MVALFDPRAQQAFGALRTDVTCLKLDLELGFLLTEVEQAAAGLWVQKALHVVRAAQRAQTVRDDLIRRERGGRHAGDVEEESVGLSVDERTVIRREKSRPIYLELLAWCPTYQPHEPPETPLAAACAYLINHHIALMRFLDDGERAAIAYSILGTCCLLGLSPVAYLSDIVPTLARGVERDDIAALMPKAWLHAHLAAAITPLR